MKPLELDILFHNESTEVQNSIGIDYSLQDCDIRKVTFFHIDAVTPYIDNNIEYSSIFSSGQVFTCVLTYREAVEAIILYQ